MKKSVIIVIIIIIKAHIKLTLPLHSYYRHRNEEFHYQSVEFSR